MIQKNTKLYVADNSGIRSVYCIGILGKKKMCASIGTELIVSVYSVISNKHIKKGTILIAIVVRQKKWFQRISGMNLCFNTNCVVLMERITRNFLANRIRGSVPRELRRRKYLRIICIADMVI